MSNPQCWAASSQSPGCAAERFKATIREMGAEIERLQLINASAHLIPVSERLPPFSRMRVIGYESRTGWRGEVTYWAPGDWRVSNPSCNGGYEGKSITHWTQLPGAPALEDGQLISDTAPVRK